MNFIKRSVYLAGLVLSLPAIIFSQGNPYASRVYEYKPAPGQYINDPVSGTPEIAASLTTDTHKVLSLGAYGGYVILAFDRPVDNHPDNPYGVDFLIAGNAFTGSAEPGIVKVMKDENSNGIPDDTWYELAGSRHFGPGIERNYKLVYYKPGADGANVLWKDMYGDSSYVFHNDFHSQPYYPSTEYFPEYEHDSIMFRGSLLHVSPEVSEGIIRTGEFSFGYADCKPVNSGKSLSLPDNPYTPDLVEGYGGDAFDISWAVDSAGNYMDLDEVSFIMIQSACNAEAGILGEISTEVSAVVDIPPSPGMSYESRIISLENIPDVLPAGGSYELWTDYFENGRKISRDIDYFLSNPAVASVKSGRLLTLKGGTISLSAKLRDDPSVVSTKEIRITEPSSIKMELKFSYLPVGRMGYGEICILDQDGKTIDGAYPSPEVSDTSVAIVSEISGGKFVIQGRLPGKTEISAGLPGRDDISVSKTIEVVPDLPAVEISASVKNENTSLIPRKKYRVKKTNLEPFIERKTVDSDNPFSFINLAEAITTIFTENDFNDGGRTFRFRADEYGGNKLYLWQVGMDWEFWYGWGGYREEVSHESCWIIMVNDTLFVNNLNQVEVKEGDRITILRLEDTDHEFQNLVLQPSPGNDPGADTVYCRLYRYRQDNYGRLFLKEKVVPENQMVLFDGENAGMLYDLLEEGENYFLIDQNSQKPLYLWLENYPAEVAYLDVKNGLMKNEAEHWEVYPVPFKEQLKVSFRREVSGKASIFDMQGRKVSDGTSFSGNHCILKTSELPPGAYILRIELPGKSMGTIVVKGPLQ